MSIATKSRGWPPNERRDSHGDTANRVSIPMQLSEPKSEDPVRGRGPVLPKPRGARSAFAGWDLGRNDHTDEVGRGRPAELDEPKPTPF